MERSNGTAPALDTGPRESLEDVLYEIKRVIVGQDAMLERLLVALLTGGHVLLEGVPGLAKTLTVKTLAEVVSGSFKRVQFTPDLVPADLVGTRIYRPDSGRFDVELGPVLCNFLLADEINRAPAKVQSALLEVMQEDQVTIAGHSYPVPQPFLVLATQNPIESEGTYPLPEAQTDRFLMKLVVDYPSPGEEAAVVGRSLEPRPDVRRRAEASDLLAFRDEVTRVYVDREVIGYAVALADATRNPEAWGIGELAGYIEYGVSPRGPIGLVQAARALALLRGRTHAMLSDVRDLAPDVLRHRLVLSYEALSDGVTADQMLDRVVAAVEPDADDQCAGRASPRRRRRSWPRDEGGAARSARRPQGSRADRRAPRRGARPVVRAAGRRAPARRAPRPRSGRRHRAGDIARIPAGRRRAAPRRLGHGSHRRAARAPRRAGAPGQHVGGAGRVAVDGVRDRPSASRRTWRRERCACSPASPPAAAGAWRSWSAAASASSCCRRAEDAAQARPWRDSSAPAWFPTGAETLRRSSAACPGSGGWRACQGWWSWSRTSADRLELRPAAARARRAPLGRGDRGARPA